MRRKRHVKALILRTFAMADRPASIQDLRDRLTGLLADWGAELSLVLQELDEKRARVAELEGRATGPQQQSGRRSKSASTVNSN